LENGRVEVPIRFNFIEEVGGDVFVLLLIVLTRKQRYSRRVAIWRVWMRLQDTL